MKTIIKNSHPLAHSQKGFFNVLPNYSAFDFLLDRCGNQEEAMCNKDNIYHPLSDIVENDTHFEINLTAPGIFKEDFKIEIEKKVLVVSYERKFQKEENKNYHRIESYYGSFQRTFNLPDNTDIDNINAVYQNGILKLSIPKTNITPQKRSIQIQ